MTQANSTNPFDQTTAPGLAPAHAADPSGDLSPASDATAVDLSSFDGEFDAAQAADSEEVPDGKYQVRVFSVKLGHSQKGDPMLKWDLVVIAGGNGQHAGRHIFKNAVISQASLPFVKGDLKTLGLQLSKFSELPARLPELLDLTVEVTKRTKGDYTNVYFNKLLILSPGAAEGMVQPRGKVPF